MNEFILRKATIKDIPFLVDTIIEAEKSGTSILTYTTIFGLTEEKTKEYLAKMLEEEVDGCEFSVSGFVLAEKDGIVYGAVGAWVEGSEGISATVLKGNLLSYVLPPDYLDKAISLKNIVRDLHIEYVMNTIQIGLVYVAPEARGKRLVHKLIGHKIELLKGDFPNMKKSYIQVFGNNIPAIRAYEKAGFRTIFTKKSSLPETAQYMPYGTKILMMKEI